MVDPDIITAITAGVSTIVGIIASSSITVYRINQLEKKVDKHNCIIERTAVLENETKNIKDEITELKHMIAR